MRTHTSGLRRLIQCLGCSSLSLVLLSGCSAMHDIGSTLGGSQTTTAATPTITAQPANATVAIGQSASFSVAATGSGSLTYQWRQNAVNISGATLPTYTTPAATASDSGSKFDVVISDDSGSITSSSSGSASTSSNPATLTVVVVTPPAVATQPQTESVSVGQTATFTVTATGGAPLSYQWQKDAVNIAGATFPSYTTPVATAADNGSTYSVVVTNGAGSVTSSSATLDVSIPTVASYYVATNGSDSADGSSGSPFATLQRAQLAMQQSSVKLTQIYAGTYYLTTPLTLTSLDQGETWQPVSGATVVLSGGQVISGWNSEGNGIYSASAPQHVGLDLSIAGVRQLPAARGYDPERPYITGWRLLPPTQEQNFGVTFAALPADFTSSVKPGAVLQVLDFLRYTDQITTIVGVDANNNTITVADQFNLGTTTPGIGGSWRVLNDPADLGAPGEFAYDAASSKVYVEPSSPDTLSSDTVVAAQLGTLIQLNNVSGIKISGLTFSDTTSDKGIYSGMFNDKLATIVATGLTKSSISGNTFVNAGNGISLSGSSNNQISGNQFQQMGGSAIFLTAKSNQNKITTNTITGLGRINVGSTGIHLENSGNNLVDSNTVDGSPRWGIDLYPSDSVSLVGNTVSNNVLRNTGQQTNDTGAIYSYAGNDPSYAIENTTISGNRIENVGGLLRDAFGNYKLGFTYGVYMDDQVSGVAMNNNVVESDGTGMFLCHGCKGNSASNNVLVLQPPASYDRGVNGVTYSTGDIVYNGTVRVDLMPSHFPAALTTTSIVVQLSGQASGGVSATFNVQADGVVVGTGTASASLANYVFTAQLTPHQIHRIGVALTNGVTSGTATTALHNLALFVNNTAVSLVAPEASGSYGAYGFMVGKDNLEVTNFSAVHNIVYRNGGSSWNMEDWSDFGGGTYVDPNPGIVDDNVLYQSVARAGDAVFGNQQLDVHSVLTNPLFTNAQTGDYSLQPNSPALALGFTTEGVPLAQ